MSHARALKAEVECLSRALDLPTRERDDQNREVEQLRDLLADVRPVLDRLLRDAGWFDHELLARIDAAFSLSRLENP